MLLDVGAVLILIAAPTFASLGSSLFLGGDFQKLGRDRFEREMKTPTAFDIKSFDSMILSLRLAPIILFVILRSGEPWSRFGIVKLKYHDVLLGLCLWLIVATLDFLTSAKFNRPIPSSPYILTAVPFGRAVLLAGQCCAIGFSEELAMRAYLIPRLETITGSTWKSIVLSVLVFGFVHLYKGYVGVIHSILAATVWGMAFCMTRRLWPVAISHSIVDFVVSTHLAALTGA